MPANNQLDKYYRFLRENRNQIHKALQDAYTHHYDRLHRIVVDNCGFGAYVGIPLFVVWLIWGYHMETTREQMFPAAVLLVLGLILRYFTNRVVTTAYRETFFLREYHPTLAAFVEEKRQEALSGLSSQEEIDSVNQDFDYFAHGIQLERFHYYNKYEIDKNGRYKRIKFN